MRRYHSMLRAAAGTLLAEPTVDPHYANVVLIWGMDAVSGTDPKGKVLTTSGSPTLDTSNALYGTGSVRFDAFGDRLICAASTDWTFPGDFTIELAYYSVGENGVGNTEHAGLIGTSGILSTGWNMLLINPTAAIAGSQILLEVRSSSVDWGAGLGANMTFNHGQWYVLAAQRSGTALHLFVDGVVVDSATSSATLNSNNNELWIGHQNVSSSLGRWPNGNIDEIRITKGVARYDPNTGYTPRVTPFPRQ